jgi:hypothetical protein
LFSPCITLIYKSHKSQLANGLEIFFDLLGDLRNRMMEAVVKETVIENEMHICDEFSE